MLLLWASCPASQQGQHKAWLSCPRGLPGADSRDPAPHPMSVCCGSVAEATEVDLSTRVGCTPAGTSAGSWACTWGSTTYGPTMWPWPTSWKPPAFLGEPGTLRAAVRDSNPTFCVGTRGILAVSAPHRHGRGLCWAGSGA